MRGTEELENIGNYDNLFFSICYYACKVVALKEILGLKLQEAKAGGLGAKNVTTSKLRLGSGEQGRFIVTSTQVTKSYISVNNHNQSFASKLRKR